jgi:hypothetical protein
MGRLLYEHTMLCFPWYLFLAIVCSTHKAVVFRVCDVGWHGCMASLLQKILKSKNEPKILLTSVNKIKKFNFLIDFRSIY